MATIGTFTASDNGYVGSIKTLTLNIKARFAPVREGQRQGARLPVVPAKMRYWQNALAHHGPMVDLPGIAVAEIVLLSRLPIRFATSVGYFFFTSPRRPARSTARARSFLTSMQRGRRPQSRPDSPRH